MDDESPDRYKMMLAAQAMVKSSRTSLEFQWVKHLAKKAMSKVEILLWIFILGMSLHGCEK